MKIMLVNGSPHVHGCTDAALQEIARVLEAEGAGCEIFWIGNQPIGGCMGCGQCRTLGKCVMEDSVNVFLDKARDYDGFVFGSPVHYAGISGAMTSFMDRVFYAGSSQFYLKPGASIVSARRAGTTAALDQMNKYMTISQMPVISSCYWNMVHGSKPEEIRQDEEGLQVMRTLAHNMLYFLRCKEAGRRLGVSLPEREPRVFTNFVR